jgi:hypothetical protein
MSRNPFYAAALTGLALVGFSSVAQAVLFRNFSEFGTTVNGYQDDFNGTTLNSSWTEFNAAPADPAHFTLTGTGSLMMHPANSDPNKLLYNPAGGYDTTTQNVLALIRMTTEGPNIDGGRGGVTAVSDAGIGQGLNLHFRQPGQNGNGNHYNLLDDLRAWGPSTDPLIGGATWVTGEYMWLRLVVDASGTPFGKIWPAGNTPEPANFDLVWGPRGRAGLAGLVTNSIAGANEFEVDYVLIQAAGLPSIAVVPEPATGMLGLAAAALGLARRRR